MNLVSLDQYKTPVDIAYLGTLAKNNELRIAEQMKQYEYFTGDKVKLAEYLTAALQRTWREYSVKKMPKGYLNITRKIINALSAVYVQAPKRSIKVKGSIDDDLTTYFNSILSPTLNKIDKRTHRLGKLHNTAVPFVTFKNGKFTQTVESSWLYNVYTSYNSNDEIDKITYQQYFDDAAGKANLYTVVWTNTEYYKTDDLGNKSPVVPGTGIKNPYGMVPVPFLRFNDEGDFWGEGQNILISENEVINVLKTKLNYDDIIMGTSGILFGTNLGKVNTSMDEDGDVEIKGGKDSLVNINQKPSDTHPADLKFVSTNPQIAEVMKAIDWEIKSLAMSLGLNPSNFSVIEMAQSGFSRLIESVEQMEVRTDDMDACLEYEIRRFEIIKRMNNVLASGNYRGAENLKKIDENAELIVDFADVDNSLTGTELWADRAEREKRGMGTPVQWLRDDNPDIKSDKEAEEIIQINKDVNEALEVDKIHTAGLEGDGRAKTEPTADGKDIGNGMKNKLDK